jgi:hypothetical protein
MHQGLVNSIEGTLFPRRVPGLVDLLPGTLEASLDLLVTYDTDMLLVSADQLDLLLDPSIQLIQTGDDVAKIENWTSFVVHLVKDIVTEKFEVVALARLGPGRTGLVQKRWVVASNRCAASVRPL